MKTLHLTKVEQQVAKGVLCLVLDHRGHHSEYRSSNGHTFIRDFFLMYSFPLRLTFKCGEAIQPNQYWILLIVERTKFLL